MAAITEAALATPTNIKLARDANVVHEKIEQAQLVGEPDQRLQACGVQRDGVGLLAEVLAQLQRVVQVVPGITRGGKLGMAQ